MRTAMIGLACLLAGCGPALEADEIEAVGEEAPGEQTAAIEKPCRTYTESQLILAGDYVVCGTRPFAQATTFRFSPEPGSTGTVTVRLQSGPDVSYVYVDTWPAMQFSWRQYYGGFVRVTPLNGKVRLFMY